MQTLKYRDAPETPNSGIQTGKTGASKQGFTACIAAAQIPYKKEMTQHVIPLGQGVPV